MSLMSSLISINLGWLDSRSLLVGSYGHLTHNSLNYPYPLNPINTSSCPIVERENWMVMLCCWIDYLAQSIREHKRASWSYRGWGFCLVEEFFNTKAMVVSFFIDFLMHSWFLSHIYIVLISHIYVTGFHSHLYECVNNVLVSSMFLFVWHVL